MPKEIQLARTMDLDKPLEIDHRRFMRMEHYMINAKVDYETARSFPMFETEETIEMKKQAYNFAQYQYIKARNAYYMGL